MDSSFTTTASLSESDSRKATIAAINATALYVLTYLLVQGLFQLATIGMATRMGISSIWHLSRLEFPIADSAWWPSAVIAVYGIGPALSLSIGLAAAFWFWKRARLQRGLFKLFLFWVMLHGCNLALGALAVDTLTQSGVWYVPSWLFMAGNAVNVVLALLAALLQICLGYVAAIAFLHSHDSITLMKHSNRRRLLLGTLVGPWLVGSLVLAALQWPEQTLNEQLRVLSMLLLIGPVYIAATNEAFEATVPLPGKTRVIKSLLVLLVLALLTWRLGLHSGLHFN
ncbi:hypothetical protein [Hymenobacter sp.]|jgi:hypothetical protein|uniref:hypothetical protein n=1 Tax=Hymenobacter sp. TaxID=1898978 RepID=UPI002EDB6F54